MADQSPTDPDRPSGSEPTDELLERIRAGDASAREDLLTRKREELRSYLKRRMGQAARAREDASDLAQKTLIELDRQLDGYVAAPPQPFDPWARRRADDQVVQAFRRHVRAKKRSVRQEDGVGAPLAESVPGGEESPSAILITRQRAERVRSALEQLSESDREIIELHYFGKTSLADVARLLAITPEAARQRHRRALMKLGTILSDLDSD